MRKAAALATAVLMSGMAGGSAFASLSRSDAQVINSHVVSAVPDANGGTGGYVLYSNGKLLALGGAPFYGDARAKGLNDFSAIGQDGNSSGYWLVTATGQVFTFGNVCQGDRIAEAKVAPPIVGTMFMSRAQQNNVNIDTGFLMVNAEGNVFTYACQLTY